LLIKEVTKNMKIQTILMFSGLLVMSSMSLSAEDTWTKKADMPTATSFHSASVVGGKIYVIGGFLNPSTAVSTATVEVYDTGFVPPKPTSVEAKGKLTTTWGEIKSSR
jgi:hypothetical protein